MTEDIMDYLEKKKPEIEESIRKFLPKEFGKEYIEWAFGDARYSYDSDSLNNALSKPLLDFLERGGKRWRPALFLLISEILGSDIDKIRDFSILPELAHNGCLPAETRVHKNPGEHVQINSIRKGDYVYCIDHIGELARRKVLGVKNNGRKRVYSLKTRNREVRATRNHPFLTVEREHPVKYKITPSGKRRLYNKLKRGDLKQLSGRFDISYNVLINGLSPNVPSQLLGIHVLEYLFEYAGIKLTKKDYQERQTQFQAPNIRLQWKPLCKLQKNDPIIVLRKGFATKTPYEFPDPPKNPPKDMTKIPSYSTKEFCQIFGYLLGDGSLNLQKRYSNLVLCPSKDKAEKEKYFDLFKNVFDYELKTHLQYGYERFNCSSFKVCWLLKELGLHKKATEKDIPEWIFKVPEEQQLAFIRGYLDSDGWVQKNSYTRFASSSEKLIRNFKVLLDSLGFNVGIVTTRIVRNDHWKNARKKETRLWSVGISSPNEVLERIGSEKPEYVKRLGVKRKRRLDFKFERKYHNVPINNSHFRIDKISSIKPQGVEPVFDLMIKDSHNFIANNIIVHNSLIVDDIEDRGELRRGKPCLHKIFGEDVAVNAGNFLYFLPTLVMIKNEANLDEKIRLRTYDAYSQELINIHRPGPGYLVAQRQEARCYRGAVSPDVCLQDRYPGKAICPPGSNPCRR